MKIAYLRVSSEDQQLDRQEDLANSAEKVFRDKASGKDRERPELTALIEFAREGDSVHVWSIDRLARSLHDLDGIVSELTAKGVSVTFEKERMTFSADSADLYQRVMFQVLGAFAEFERNLSKQRQREGIEKARAAGKYKGRKRVLTDEAVAVIQESVDNGAPLARLAREHGVSRTTLYRELKAVAA